MSPDRFSIETQVEVRVTAPGDYKRQRLLALLFKPEAEQVTDEQVEGGEAA
jgi:hypothetical protein